ncbi:MAG TPA: CBS domain-containing protein [Archaeoglobaceae archaeon]|nr:CBS domain-containing protein [Archaeoglobaceae archaeon]
MILEIEEIKRRRKKLGITQKKLAEILGVSQPLIARIESGSIDPKLSLVKKIFSILEMFEGKMNARNIMHFPVKYVNPDTTIKEVIEMMRADGISQMPVISDERVTGSITESSIVKLILSKGLDAKDMKVRDFMEESFPSVSPDEGIELISKMLLNSPALLVVDEGKIAGIITKHDVMKALMS